MAYTILDCYTDEAAGLGVPPYLGTYPRYIAGYLNEPVHYLTIDDLRFYKKYGSKLKEPKPSQKTDIFTYNLTKNAGNVGEILQNTDMLVVVLGVHVPGKYLSAVPGTIHELIPLIADLPCKKILTGPAVFGTQMFGGKFFEKYDKEVFDRIDANLFKFDYGKAKDYYNKGEYAKALDAIRLAKQGSGDNKQLLELEDEIKFKMKEERIEDHYKEGMIRYRQKNFAGARKEFEAILSILPE